MTTVYARFPDDPDVASLYADSVMNTMPWDYWTTGGLPKPGIAGARKALEGVMKRQPEHLGAHHIYIHLIEASDEVDLAVPSADRLGSLAPGAGHLVHMPAHVYIRVGRYADAVDANLRAVTADENYITQCRAQGIYTAAYYPHNIHFLNAALAMDGRSREALDSARKVATKHDHSQMAGFGFAHSLKTLPILNMVRFARWEDVLKEPEPPEDEIFGRAMRHFGRGYALSAQGQTADAKAELAALKKASAHPSLAELKILDLNSLAKISAIAVAMLEGEIARRANEFNAAIASYRAAASMEDGLLYSEPPDWLLPPRQYLGETLLAAGRSKDAEKIYREDLKRHRDNGWSLRGLELTLRKQGRGAEAEAVRTRFSTAWSRADVMLQASRL